MGAQRVAFSAALTAAFLSWLVNGTDFSFLWLTALTVMPFFCLIFSLPAMTSFRLRPKAQRVYFLGRQGQMMLLGTCAHPMPPFGGKLRLTHLLTDKKSWYDPNLGVPTDHVGGYSVCIHRGRVCDYLGLFSIPAGRNAEIRFSVFPREVPIENLPDFQLPGVRTWKSVQQPEEQYELRPYRMGDSPRNLHWKLSLKTGRPIVRQGQEPTPIPITVDMVSRGKPEELDEKYGQLLYLGRKLLDKQLPYRLRVLTGRGIQVIAISTQKELRRGIAQLLQQPCAAPEERLPPSGSVLHYCIGEDCT